MLRGEAAAPFPSRWPSAMSQAYLAVFAELIRTPFQHLELVWGIVPLYFALLLSELTSAKKNFNTAIQTGFSFLWAGAQWLYRSEEHTSELQSLRHLVCRLLLE